MPTDMLDSSQSTIHIILFQTSELLITLISLLEMLTHPFISQILFHSLHYILLVPESPIIGHFGVLTCLRGYLLTQAWELQEDRDHAYLSLYSQHQAQNLEDGRCPVNVC